MHASNAIGTVPKKRPALSDLSGINSLRTIDLSATLPAQNLDAERGVLGSIFFDNNRLDDVSAIIKPEYFYLDSHRTIFGAICRLREKDRRQFDAITVGEELERAGEMKKAGGFEYFREICECTPHAAHATSYAELVREKALRRMTCAACSDGISNAFDENRPIEESVAEVDSRLMSVLEHGTPQGETDIGTALLDAMAEIQKGRKRGVLTGFDQFDELTNGLQPGSLSILAARPSVGKTAFVVSLVLQIAERGIPVLFLSLEQSRHEIAMRTLSIRCGISFHELRKQGSTVNETQSDSIMRESNTVAEWPIFVDDTADRDLAGVAAVCRSMKRKNKIGFVVIDYLQLMRAHDPRIPREQQVAHMSRGLKMLAKSLDIPILVLAQLNRQVEMRDAKSRRPKLSDLRESGAIEQDADIVVFIDRPAMYDSDAHESLAKLYVEKQRNGPRGDVVLNWTPGTMRFKNGAPVGWHPEQQEAEQRDWTR